MTPPFLVIGVVERDRGTLYCSVLLCYEFDFDVVGHYARPDVFRLLVNTAPMPPVVRGADWAPPNGPGTSPS